MKIGQNRHMFVNPYELELLHVILIDLVDIDSHIALMTRTQEGKKSLKIYTDLVELIKIGIEHRRINQ